MLKHMVMSINTNCFGSTEAALDRDGSAGPRQGG